MKFFLDKQSIHIKLPRDIHHALKIKLLQYEVTMQDFFEEAALGILKDDNETDKQLKAIKKIAIKKEIKRVAEKQTSKNNRESNIDAELLYNLLEAGDDVDKSKR